MSSVPGHADEFVLAGEPESFMRTALPRLANLRRQSVIPSPTERKRR